ncbi:MAG: putative CocE/NonD family hydrolase, partial [Glaciecola sp.]
MRRPVRLFAATLSAFVLGSQVATATAAEPPAGGVWTEQFITTADGESLHVDIIRGEGIAADVKQPVILIASPYLGLESPTETPGPSSRFFDLIEGANLLEHYTVVQVSLRGTGGSSGCLDILGPGEQEDVRAGVEFAASAPFSDGNVGMYGKSYDANTGALALATRPEHLDAVVAQQIAADRYRGSYNDRVRLLQSLVYPSATYGTSAEGGFSLSSDPEAIANSLGRSADCQVFLAEHYVDDEQSAFWRVRDFVDLAQGSTIPALITTGYLDNPTNIGAGAVDLFNALGGPKQLWIGWWDHVRGNDTVGDRLAMGREDWFGTVRRFLDFHVRGLSPAEAPTHLDPIVAAQGSDGYWREEQAFPAPDTVMTDAPVNSGTYDDDNTNEGSNDSALGSGGAGGLNASPGNGTWTFSAPLETDVHVAGIPTAVLDVSPMVPRSNVVLNIYDVDEDGMATMISRGAALVDGSGEK